MLGINETRYIFPLFYVVEVCVRVTLTYQVGGVGG
jgi:hypothetical protein